MTDDKSTSPVAYKTIPGYEGYRFGDDGSVWSCRTNRKGRFKEWYRLKGTPSSHYGHIKVELVFNGRPVIKSAHSLILEAFIGPCPDGLECCHGPGGKTDNRLCNLRWDTHKNNIADKARDGTKLLGERCPNAKITEVQAATVIRLRKLSLRIVDIVKATGVPRASVTKIIARKHWKYLYEGEAWRSVLIAAGLEHSVA